jgi:hypothetical protein
MDITKVVTIWVALHVVSGCASHTPHFDRQFGIAVDTAKALQTVNPDAARNSDPVAGISGNPADAAVDEYHDSFRTPPPSFPVISIGVGGGR